MTGADSMNVDQQALISAVAEVRAALEAHVARCGGAPVPGPRESAEDHSPPSALDLLCSVFGLSRFERSILVLCASVDLDAEISGLCAAAQGNPARSYPTFSLAMAALPEPHWSGVTPAGPLRRWRLIEVATQTGVPLVLSPLNIDERVLHFLVGVQYTDERLAALLAPVQGDDLVPSHRSISSQIVARWAHQSSTNAGYPIAAIQLCGQDPAANRPIAAAACRELGLNLYAICADALPSIGSELDGLVRLWERESALNAAALLLELDSIDRYDPRVVSNVGCFLERVRGPVLLSSREPWRRLHRPIHTFEVAKPTSEEQREVWNGLSNGASVQANGWVDRIVSQFNLGLPAIRESFSSAVQSASAEEDLSAAFWRAGRLHSRPRLEGMAQRIDSQATWNDLVLPETETAVLHEIAANVHHRSTVYGSWGFGVVERGQGITALFSGASGTGKTLAAEVLANALSLDLYRIDLSCVVSKYIGETEKNLRRVFDAAEHGGAILFFDEADALFGKRSEVKDSHDRYANIEISYLLQRMEAYRGLAILATNMKSALDSAFLRRLRFIVNFPFPDGEQRARIWRQIFPPNTPVEPLDIGALARLSLAGGNIRNIALNAAFRAAETGNPVRMEYILRAVRGEFAKIDKPLTKAEMTGWAEWENRIQDSGFRIQ
jgi:ATPase family associated with various cellular activities (AAA)